MSLLRDQTSSPSPFDGEQVPALEGYGPPLPPFTAPEAPSTSIGGAAPAIVAPLFASLFDGPDDDGGGGGSASPALGLDTYRIVPDDYAKPLKAGEMRKSDHDELKRFGFDKLGVVDDATTKQRKLKAAEMTQGDFDRLAQSWLNISHGKGMKLTEGKAGQIDKFKHMLRAGLTDSPEMRGLLTEIGANKEGAADVSVDLRENAPGVFIDSFKKGILDLEDLERLPSVHDKGHIKNEVSREEQLVHVLSERRQAALLRQKLAKSNKTMTDEKLFDEVHALGLKSQNQYRKERGEVGVKSGTTHPLAGMPGSDLTEYLFEDGNAEYIRTENNGRIKTVSPPTKRILPP